MSDTGDYISRTDAIEAMYKDAEVHPDHVFWTTQHEALRSIPAADVRPVVLCRDCKHEGLLSCPLTMIEKRQMVFINHDPEFFCAAAERKDADA